MQPIGRFFKIFAILASAFVGAGLIFAGYNRLGLLSVLFAALGAGFIWVLYFLWKGIFTHTYEEGIEEGRKQQREPQEEQ